MKQLKCFISLLLLAMIVSPVYSQPYEYTKTVLFSLEWGDEDQQVGFKDGNAIGNFPKAGPSDFTVTSNGFIVVYDTVQNSIKFFDKDGILINKYVQKEHVGIEGFLTCDASDNIWYHDALHHRVYRFSYQGDLIYTISYESDVIYGNIVIVNDKPVMSVNMMLDHWIKYLDKGFDNKLEYKAQLIDTDTTSIYNYNRGRFSNRIYSMINLDISDEGDIILPQLSINGELVSEVGFEDVIIKKYSIFYRNEDKYGHYYLYLFPRYQEDVYPYLYKYNMNNELVAMIELPRTPQKYGFASDPVYINSNGDIYYMELRDEAVTFYMWSLQEG